MIDEDTQQDAGSCLTVRKHMDPLGDHAGLRAAERAFLGAFTHLRMTGIRHVRDLFGVLPEAKPEVHFDVSHGAPPIPPYLREARREAELASRLPAPPVQREGIPGFPQVEFSTYIEELERARSLASPTPSAAEATAAFTPRRLPRAARGFGVEE